MKVCVTVPNLPPQEAGELVSDLIEKFKGVAEVKVVGSTKFAEAPHTVAIRIITDDTKFNKHIDLFKDIKREFPNATVRVETYQSGGGRTNTGWATVTALADGSMPQKVAGSRYANGVHAIYWISEGFIIECSRWNKAEYIYEGSIHFVKINFNGFKMYKVGRFRANPTESIFRAESTEGIEVEIERPELQRNLSKLMPAIKKAIRKSGCYHCRTEHTW